MDGYEPVSRAQQTEFSWDNLPDASDEAVKLPDEFWTNLFADPSSPTFCSHPHLPQGALAPRFPIPHSPTTAINHVRFISKVCAQKLYLGDRHLNLD